MRWGLWLRRVLLAPLCIHPVFAARCLWHWRPTLWTAVVMCAVWTVWFGLKVAESPEPWRVVTYTGIVLNMAVILRNNGRMPVVGLKQRREASAWVRANRKHRWLWLADRRSLAFCSIGDVLILGGLFIAWMW